MTAPAGEGWLDGDEARPVRPYAVTRGRTTPGMKLDLMSMIAATGSGPGIHLEPEHERALSLCRRPATVAEIAARLRLPAAAAKVVLSDLAGWGAVRVAPPLTVAQATHHDLLEKILHGLQQL